METQKMATLWSVFPFGIVPQGQTKPGLQSFFFPLSEGLIPKEEIRLDFVRRLCCLQPPVRFLVLRFPRLLFLCVAKRLSFAT